MDQHGFCNPVGIWAWILALPFSRCLTYQPFKRYLLSTYCTPGTVLSMIPMWSHFMLRTALKGRIIIILILQIRCPFLSYARGFKCPTPKHTFSTTLRWTSCPLVAQPCQELTRVIRPISFSFCSAAMQGVLGPWQRAVESFRAKAGNRVLFNPTESCWRSY